MGTVFLIIPIETATTATTTTTCKEGGCTRGGGSEEEEVFFFVCFPFGSVDWEEWGQAKKVASPRKEAKEPQAGAVKQTIYGCVIPDIIVFSYRLPTLTTLGHP